MADRQVNKQGSLVMNKRIASAAFALVLGGLGVAAPASAEVVAAPAGVVKAACNLSVDWQTTTTVNLRGRPTLNGPVKRSVPKGACLKLRDTAWDDRGVMWIYTSYKGSSGWISTRNLM